MFAAFNICCFSYAKQNCDWKANFEDKYRVTLQVRTDGTPCIDILLFLPNENECGKHYLTDAEGKLFINTVGNKQLIENIAMDKMDRSERQFGARHTCYGGDCSPPCVFDDCETHLGCNWKNPLKPKDILSIDYEIRVMICTNSRDTILVNSKGKMHLDSLKRL